MSEGYKNNPIKAEIMFNLLREKMKYGSLIICKVDKGQTTLTVEADNYIALYEGESPGGSC